MKYVLDSSVALKWVLPEPDSGRAVRLRDEYNALVHDLIAPDIFTPEIASGLAVAERQGRIKTGEAAIFLLDIVRNSSHAALARSSHGDFSGDETGRLRLRLRCVGGGSELRDGQCG